MGTNIEFLKPISFALAIACIIKAIQLMASLYYLSDNTDGAISIERAKEIWKMKKSNIKIILKSVFHIIFALLFLFLFLII